MDLDLSNVSEEVLQLNPELAKMAVKKPSKYRNVRTSLEGVSFDSGKEAVDARNFMLGVRAGEWIAYLHHIVVRLPGDIKMELDHVLINNQMHIEVFDSKGGTATITKEYKLKKRLFLEKYGLEIKEI